MNPAAAQQLLVMSKIIGLLLGVLAIFTIGIILVIDIWAKKAAQGRIYALFLEQRSLFSKLLKIDNGKVYLGKGDAKEEYLLDTKKQFWAMWPGGLPKFLQVPIRAHWYLRNSPEPVDPENAEATLSARSRRMLSDEAMLKATWHDVRESTMGPQTAQRGSGMALILIFMCLMASSLNIYLTMSIQKMLKG